jgi:Domain of unknown function DUF11/Outer membrane lipoprotein
MYLKLNFHIQLPRLGKVDSVDVTAILRAAVGRSLLGLILLISLLATPAFPLDSQDSQIFIAGFNAYQNKDYQGAIGKMSLVLEKYPDTPLRDMALFWLARAHFKAGHRAEAAQYMAQFLREYPDSPLKGTVEPELAQLAAANGKEEMAKGAEKTEAGHAAAEKQSAEKAAAEKAAAEKQSAEKAEADRLAVEKVRLERVAAEKATIEKVAAEKAAQAKGGEEVVAAPKEIRPFKKGQARIKAGKRKAAQAAALKEKAVAGYKGVIDQYPGSPAALTAAAKLKELGIVYPPRVGRESGAPGATAQVFTLEVGQLADFAFDVAPVAQNYPAGKQLVIPFELVNRGNGPDSFSLESGFPPEFDVRFAAAAAPGVAVTATPQLAAGEKFTGVLTAIIPRVSIDGQKSIFPVKAVSQAAREVSQSREITLVAAAPLLRAVIKPDKGMVLPGAKVAYRIALLNVGSAEVGGVTLRLDYPPQYEPVDFISSGFRQEMKGALVLDALRINSGESRELTVAFQLRDDAEAGQELFVRGDVSNNELETRESFLSVAAVVQGVSGVTARTSAGKLVVIPGQTVTVPVVVTNTGNLREVFRIRPDVTAGLTCRFLLNPERAGKRKSAEEGITVIGPLAPREEAYLLMELATPAGAADGSDAMASVLLEPESGQGKNAAVTVRLRFARPVVELAMAGKGGKMRPGEVSSFELTVVNRGSSLARSVEVRSMLPDHLEMVAAEPSVPKGNSGEYAWKFAELGAGERRSVRVTFRVKGGIPVGTGIQIRNTVTYEDQLGNRY